MKRCKKKGKKSYTILFRLKEKVVIMQVLIIQVIEPRKKKPLRVMYNNNKGVDAFQRILLQKLLNR